MNPERPDNDAADSADERSEGTERRATGAGAPGAAKAGPDDAPDAAREDAAEAPSQPDKAETGTAETGTAETDTAETDTAETDTAETDTAETDTAETDTAETGTTETGTTETGTTETDKAETDPTGSGDDADTAGPDDAAEAGAEAGVEAEAGGDRDAEAGGDRDAGASAEVPGPHELDHAPPSRRRTPVLVASVAAAVLLVGGGGAYLAMGASGGSGSGADPGASGDGGTPPPLALDGYAGSGSNGIAPGEPNPYGVTYRVDGPLPGGPGSAPVYRASGEVGKDEVVRLAKALGLDGTPVLRGQAWQIGPSKDGSGPSLMVDKQAPGTWTFRRYAGGTDDCDGIATCTKDPANPAGKRVSAEDAERAAAPVLKAIGQDDAKVDASQVMGAQRVVNANPEVGGLPTYGWATGLTVSAQGEVVGGTGRLKAPVKSDTYPVLSAQKTLELMNSAPTTDHRMGIGGCASPVPLKDRLEQPCGRSTTGTAPKETVTIESAVFGLAARAVDGRQALVPSWLFQVKGADARNGFTATYPAVDPKYLASDAATPTPSATAPGDEPTSAPATRDVKVDGWTADGRELTVSFMGGVCADYTATAAESADRVTVKVTEKPWKGKVCIMIAKEIHKTVRLDRPVGDRTVTDSDGKALPQAKQGARLPRTAAVQ